MEKPKPEKFYRVDIVAEMLCVSKSILYYQMSAGNLRYIRHGRRKGYRVPSSAVDEYLQKLRDGAGAE
jgi:excisionase family DNA binding protein